MKRRLLNVLTGLSLLLFVLLAAASIRSRFFVREHLKWGEATGMTWHRVVLRLGRGQVGVAVMRLNHLPPVPADVVSKVNDEHGNFRTDGVEYGRVDDARKTPRYVNSFWRRRGFYFHFRRDRSPTYLYRDSDSTYHKQPTVTTNLIADTPYWPLLLLTAAPPALHVVRAWRCRRRAGAGRCRRCGYDLRATPGRCPECGTESVQPA